MVHGDDFTALSTDESLNRNAAQMHAAFDVELRGRLGAEAHDAKEINLLNRVLMVSSTGLRYEADPRHVELLGRALGGRTAARR